MIYGFIEYSDFNETLMWFLSGGLAMLFNAILNFLNLRLATTLTKQLTVISNSILFIFCCILYIVVSEIQVFILIIILLATLIISGVKHNNKGGYL